MLLSANVSRHLYTARHLHLVFNTGYPCQRARRRYVKELPKSGSVLITKNGRPCAGHRGHRPRSLGAVPRCMLNKRVELRFVDAAESERPSAGFRDSHRAVAAATAPRVAVLSLGAEPVLSEAEGGHPCRGNERAIRRTCGRRKNYAVNMLRALFSGASRMIPAFFPTYRFTETPRSALRA